MEIAVAIAVLVLAVLAAVSFGTPQQKLNRSVVHAWTDAARQLGVEGELTVPSPDSSEGLKFRAYVDGFSVLVEQAEQPAGTAVTPVTRLRTKTAHPEGLRLRVTPTGRITPLARAVGFEDVPTGDSTFDNTYLVKASDPALAPLWLNAKVRTAVAEAPGYQFKLERGRASAIKEGYETDATELVAAARALAAFAYGRQRIAKSWNALAELWGHGEVRVLDGGWVHLTTRVEDLAVELGTKTVGQRTFTQILVELRAEVHLAPFVLIEDAHMATSELPRRQAPFLPAAWSLYCNDLVRVEQMLDDAIRRDLEELDVVRMKVDDHRVTVLLEGAVTQRAIIRRAVMLAVHLATGPEYLPPAYELAALEPIDALKLR